MTIRDEKRDYPPDLRRTLGSLIPPLPLEERRIQATLRNADVSVRRARVRSRVLRTSGAVILLSLAAATYWKWSGANSDSQLSFANAIAVSSSPGDYTFGNVQAATGKIWRDANRVLPILMKQEAFTREMLTELVQAIDTPRIAPPAVPGRFEELQTKLKSGATLSLDEVRGMVQDLEAGIAAIQATPAFDPEHKEVAEKLCARLRKQLLPAAVAEPKGNDATQRAPQAEPQAPDPKRDEEH